jgi:hypothetical protein
VETRLVITVDGQGVHVQVCTKEPSFPVACGVNHAHDAAVALERDLVEHLMIAHDILIVGLHFCNPREGVPVPLAVIGLGTAWPWAVRSLGERAQIGVEAQCANLLTPQGTDTREALLFTVRTIGDDVAEVAQMMRRDHTGHLIPRDIHPCGLCAGCLVGTETVRAVVGDVEPSQSRDCQAFFWAAMPPVPAAVQARGRLPTFGDNTGIDDQGLVRFWRDYVEDRRLVEGDKVKVSGVPTCQGPVVLRTVAAQMPTRGVAWEHKQQSQQMRHKLLLRLLGLAQRGQYTLSQSHGVPPVSVVSGNTTIEEEDSCGYLSVKTARSIEERKAYGTGAV